MKQRSPGELREQACRYRVFAERVGNPTIWEEGALRRAEQLEEEAARDKVRT
jgi:hypothetical protein